MSKKKMILTAVILTLVLVIGGTIAFFTDTDSATNTFTIGKIDISLSEPNWNASNAQNVTPGKVIAKDPTITNDSTTNSAYVFAKVEVPALNSSTPLFTYTINSGWTEVGTASFADGKITYVYAYGNNTAMTELISGSSTSTAVFDSVTFNSTLTSSDLAGVNTTQNIVITAYGIQIDNLGETTPSGIWGLFSE